MIDTDAVMQFDFSSPEVSDIRRCLTMLYTTREGAQPLDRNFGLNRSFMDKPLQVAQNEYALEVVRKTAIYEPRVNVSGVTFESDIKTGRIIPTIHLAKGDDEDGH